jgi:hypothetical protein
MRHRIGSIVAVTGLLASMTLIQPTQLVPVAQAFSLRHMSPIQKKIVSGFVSFELSGAATTAAAAGAQETVGAQSPNYFPDAQGNCPIERGDNVKVNQNCLNLTDADLAGRGQAQNETTISVDPNDASHLVAGYNDYRRGDGTCGASYSLDGGRSWSDATMPNGFVRGDAYGAAREYLQASGDAAVAWDTKGNAYYQCQLFSRGAGVSPNPDDSSAVYVYRSTGNAGASFNFTGHPVIEHADPTGAEGGAFLEDKPYMTVDSTVGSPFQDRVYVTWTEFNSDGSAYIFASHSSNYGQTFSRPVVVSRNSSLCVQDYGAGTEHGKCNENQFSDPFTGPDGNLYVVFANFNNATASLPGGDDGRTTKKDNHYQLLLSESTNGGKSFGHPVKVADYYELPDCGTYQNGLDNGRACVPEKGPTTNSIFRATNIPTGVVNPNDPSDVAVVFGSYINRDSKESSGCTPTGFAGTGNPTYDGVKGTGGCNNDIVISTSSDGGQSFAGTTANVRKLPVVTTAHGQGSTDQFWQWAAFNSKGQLAVSYMDRSYGNDEWIGASDVSLSVSSDEHSFATSRVTTGPSPAQSQFAGLFYGDYTGLAVTDSAAFPLWSDTRDLDLVLCRGTGTPKAPPNVCTFTAPNANPANDENVYTARVALP